MTSQDREYWKNVVPGGVDLLDRLKVTKYLNKKKKQALQENYISILANLQTAKDTFNEAIKMVESRIIVPFELHRYLKPFFNDLYTILDVLEKLVSNIDDSRVSIDRNNSRYDAAVRNIRNACDHGGIPPLIYHNTKGGSITCTTDASRYGCEISHAEVLIVKTNEKIELRNVLHETYCGVKGQIESITKKILDKIII